METAQFEAFSRRSNRCFTVICTERKGVEHLGAGREFQFERETHLAMKPALSHISITTHVSRSTMFIELTARPHMFVN